MKHHFAHQVFASEVSDSKLSFATNHAKSVTYAYCIKKAGLLPCTKSSPSRSVPSRTPGKNIKNSLRHCNSLTFVTGGVAIGLSTNPPRFMHNGGLNSNQQLSGGVKIGCELLPGESQQVELPGNYGRLFSNMRGVPSDGPGWQGTGSTLEHPD